MRRSYTFFIKVLLDENEPPSLRGQIHEPAGSDVWRVTFSSAEELWRALVDRTEVVDKTAPPVEPLDGEKT